MFVCGQTPVSNEHADLSTVPDAYFVSYERMRTGLANLVPTEDRRDFDEIEGSPDMVCEIVSPTTAVRDRAHLRERYHVAGVTEYWLIYAREPNLQFDILRHTPTGYEPTPLIDGWLRSEVLQARFRLDRERDQFGLWDYTLHVRPLEL